MRAPKMSGGRKDDILRAFIRRVAARGYDHTNLGDIADELGLSKGTIVHHFGHKAQLLRELEESYMQQQLAKVRQIWDRLPDPRDRVAALIYAVVLVHVSDREATVATQREIAQLSGDPELRDIRMLRGELQGLLRAELRRGIELGLFRPVDADLATMQLFGASQWMWTWFDPEGSRGPGEVGAAYVDVFLGGLLSAPDGLARLADPAGDVSAVAREVLLGGS